MSTVRIHKISRALFYNIQFSCSDLTTFEFPQKDYSYRKINKPDRGRGSSTAVKQLACTVKGLPRYRANRGEKPRCRSLGLFVALGATKNMLEVRHMRLAQRRTSALVATLVAVRPF